MNLFRHWLKKYTVKLFIEKKWCSGLVKNEGRSAGVCEFEKTVGGKSEIGYIKHVS